MEKVKGFCDSCDNHSTNLVYDHDEYGCLIGQFCQKCFKQITEAIEHAYKDRARPFNGVAILYPDERR